MNLGQDVNHKRVIIRIGEHVALTGVLGRHLWRNFLKECPPDSIDETSLIVRAEGGDIEGELILFVEKLACTMFEGFSLSWRGRAFENRHSPSRRGI